MKTLIIKFLKSWVGKFVVFALISYLGTQTFIFLNSIKIAGNNVPEEFKIIAKHDTQMVLMDFRIYASNPGNFSIMIPEGSGSISSTEGDFDYNTSPIDKGVSIEVKTFDDDVAQWFIYEIKGGQVFPVEYKKSYVAYMLNSMMVALTVIVLISLAIRKLPA